MDVETIDEDNDVEQQQPQPQPQQPQRQQQYTNTHTNDEQTLLIALSWSAAVDATTGLTYYFNSMSGESQWDPPAWLTEVDPTTGAPINY